MFGAFSHRLLPMLQLTRMALVFTAIADGQCSLLLWAQSRALPGQSVWSALPLGRCLAMLVVSIGLYGFGMALNDIVDHRRDAALASYRPLPSGRLTLRSAHWICTLFGLAAVLASFTFLQAGLFGWLSLLLVFWTLALITFYDFAGKYLVASGLLSLGLIRFFHAVIAVPNLPLLWHPLLLLNHVTLLSTVAYRWEQKRPSLTRVHWWGVLGALAFADVSAVGLVWWRRYSPGQSFADCLDVQPGLLLPLAAVIAFVVLALAVHRRHRDRRSGGQTVMLYGLLWLIVYDAAFAAGYAGAGPAGLLLALLPVAYLGVQLMRWWSKLLALSRQPAFKRVE